MSTLRDFCEKLRTSGPYRNLVPLEASLSYPVPRKSKGGTVYMDFLIFTIERVPRTQPARVHMPYARLSVSYPYGEWVEFQRLDHTRPDWRETILGELPSLETRGVTFAESMDQRRRFYDSIERILPSLLVSPVSGNGMRASMAACLQLWESLAEPGLSEEYRTLNPEFFEWLETAVEKAE